MRTYIHVLRSDRIVEDGFNLLDLNFIKELLHMVYGEGVFMQILHFIIKNLNIYFSGGFQFGLILDILTIFSKICNIYLLYTTNLKIC